MYHSRSKKCQYFVVKNEIPRKDPVVAPLDMEPEWYRRNKPYLNFRCCPLNEENSVVVYYRVTKDKPYDVKVQLAIQGFLDDLKFSNDLLEKHDPFLFPGEEEVQEEEEEEQKKKDEESKIEIMEITPEERKLRKLDGSSLCCVDEEIIFSSDDDEVEQPIPKETAPFSEYDHLMFREILTGLDRMPNWTERFDMLKCHRSPAPTKKKPKSVSRMPPVVKPPSEPTVYDFMGVTDHPTFGKRGFRKKELAIVKKENANKKREEEKKEKFAALARGSHKIEHFF